MKIRLNLFIPLSHTRRSIRTQFNSKLHTYTCTTRTITTMSNSNAAAVDNNPSKFRLPINVVPKHYDVLIKTDLQALKFEGITKIQLDVKEPTSTITFNSSNLSIENVRLAYPESDLKTVDLANVSFDEKMERATVALPESLAQGSAIQLIIKHSRDLTDELMGYYYSTYKDEGKERCYALTQFEATAARRAFPCWDEPMLKATFEISMISKNDTVNLSNMPVEFESPVANSGIDTELFHDQDHAEWKYTRFQVTPLMSTYIVAFANGDFKYLESSYTSTLSGKTRPLRIYATKDIIDQGQFGLDVKAKVVPLYEQAFEIEYALPKLDTIVVHDFDAGAMENWGLITGRTDAFLVDPKRADIRSKQSIAETQSHEVAHMWFGNITTMKWWDNLWLNEGFATLMGEVIILNKMFPEWKVYSSFYNDHTSSALSLDSTPSSHPVQVDVPNADDIGQIFDDLSYSKAASILRMLSVYTGEEKFLKGVSLYLKAHLYGNTVADDLWSGIQQATNLDISALMTNWISQTGHPVITVKETENGIHIRQDRYFKTGVAKEDDNQTIWQVPLNALTVTPNGEASVDRQALLTTRETTYKLDTRQLWKLNQGATGFYRVLYSPEHLAKLGEEASRAGSVLSVEDRLSLISDAMALASSGHASTSSALTFIDRLRGEPEYIVWRAIQGRLNELISTWWEQPESEDLRGFLRTLIVPVVRKLGYQYPEGEDTDTRELRNTAISGAVNTNAAEVVHTLKQWFEVYLTTGSDSHIPPDLLTPVFVAATKFGGRREWEKCKQAYLDPPTPRIQLSAVAGICATRDEELIEETFKFVKTEVQSHNLYRFFYSMGRNVKFGRRTFSFLKENYDDFYKRLEGTYQFGDLIKGVSTLMSTKKDAEDFEEFFKDRDTSKISYAYSQVLDDIYAKSAWLERSKGDVSVWVEEWKRNNKIEEGM